MFTVPFIIIVSILLLVILVLIFRMTRKSSAGTGHAEAVGKFYDTHYPAFRQVYGDVIQAFRTKDLSILLDQQARVMGLKEGMHVLDAGSGVCGPAVYFAKKYGVLVEAVTVSKKQASIAGEEIGKAGLLDKVRVTCGDYHKLSTLFPGSTYDVVYFLESFGHSDDKARAIDEAWQMLKPGGLLYIKDLFTKDEGRPGHAKKIKDNIDRINQAYHYKIANLYSVLRSLRRKGFILSSLKTIDIPLEDFENLSISNKFQELTGINRIDDLQTYIFPVDFFELSCIKPGYDPAKGNNRYFLQNLYYLQVLNHSENEL